MKLHLPKMLLTAVLAACIAPAAWGATVTVSTDSNISDVKGDDTTKIEVTGGTLAFGDTDNITLSEGLYIKNGGKVTVDGDGNNGNGFVSSSTDVYIKGGGTLVLNAKDDLGYDTGATKSITLTGSSGSIAVMELKKRQTQTTDIVMEGYAEIKKASGATTEGDEWASLASWGGDFTVRNTNNVISAGIDVRQAMTINIEDKGTLLISGAIKDGTGFDNVLTISGGGEVEFGEDTLSGGTDVVVTSNIKTGSKLRVKKGSLTLGDGTTAKNTSVIRLEMSDVNNQASTVTIKDKYTLKITGSSE